MHLHQLAEAETPLNNRPQLSVVIPMFNESAVLAELFERLESVLQSLDLSSEVVMIDDGSVDSTWLELCHYQPQSFDLHAIALSRNFGKEAALTAGLQNTLGEAVIILDADCQDPPELIPQMIEHWKGGADVVNMKRRIRHGETWFKLKTAALYYQILGYLSDTPIHENVGDFRLLSRRVIDEVNRLQERNRYMKGILSWPGFDQITVEYDRDPRTTGGSKWNYWQLFFLAISGITAFSNKPLRLASLMGGLIALSSFFYGLWVMVKTLIFGDAVAGYPSMMVVILFIGGIELITIGILGEYVGRIFTEVKGRPNFIVRSNQINHRQTEDDSQSAPQPAIKQNA